MAQPVKTKRVACCKCGEDRAECPDCKEGYKQMALSGKTPHFKNKQLSLRNLSLYQHFFLVCVCRVCNCTILNVLFHTYLSKYQSLKIDTHHSCHHQP